MSAAEPSHVAPSPALLHGLVGHLPRGEMVPVTEALAPTTPAGCIIDVLGIVPTHAGPGGCGLPTAPRTAPRRGSHRRAAGGGPGWLWC